MLADFIRLIYPQNCVACGNNLYKHELQICNYCKIHLPKTNFHQSIKNPVEALFYGRVPLKFASSYYTFTKLGNVQRLLHSIKYKHNKDLAVLLGKLYGQEIKNIHETQSFDVIIPVPLHAKKLKIRGFNQSEAFAIGLAEELNIPVNTNTLIRAEFTETQTKKNKYQRWENVDDKFQLSSHQDIDGKHVVLVDDVITTGATIEACCQVLNQAPNVRVSVLSIAYASL